jgi:hypothetical protein
MATLITLEQADAHLRLDGDLLGSPPAWPALLQDVQIKMDQAESIILDYLRVDASVLEGSPPAYSVGSPPLWTERDLNVIRSAILLVLSALRDDEIERTLGDYMKPDGVISLLLARLRSPVFA